MGEVIFLHFRWGDIGDKPDQILIEMIESGCAFENIADRLGCSLQEVYHRSVKLRKMNLILGAEERMKRADRRNAERFGLKDALARVSRDADEIRELWGIPTDGDE